MARSRVLLSFKLGNVENEIEMSTGGIYGRWIDDRTYRYAIRYYWH